MKMKYLLLGLVVCLQTVHCFGQITLEKKYGVDENIHVVFLEGEGVKYSTRKQIVDANKKSLYYEIAIYNLNHSVFKTFNTPIITVGAKSSHQYANLYNISTKLFNTSSDMEYSIEYSVNDTVGEYIPCTGCSKQKITMQSSFVRTFNENGVPIFSCDTCSLNSIGANDLIQNYNCVGIANIDGKLKFAIRSNKVSDGGTIVKNGSWWSRSGSSILIYSLPGTFAAPTALNDEKLLNQDKALLSAPMPNPSSETTRIEFQLPAEANMGEITVYNNMGLRVKSYKVDNAFGDLLLNNSDLSSGNYTYQLVAGGKRIGSQKMMVIK
jgi:hypothetical protein